MAVLIPSARQATIPQLSWFCHVRVFLFFFLWSVSSELDRGQQLGVGPQGLPHSEVIPHCPRGPGPHKIPRLVDCLRSCETKTHEKCEKWWSLPISLLLTLPRPSYLLSRQARASVLPQLMTGGRHLPGPWGLIAQLLTPVDSSQLPYYRPILHEDHYCFSLCQCVGEETAGPSSWRHEREW